MPIKSGDIKLMASERLTDNPDGGGRITGNEIVDGASNNLFEDISDLDRTYGDVSLRKAYVAVRTDDTDQYYGAHIIVDEVPEDDNVGVSLFTTESWDDERVSARDRIESYVIQGPVGRLRLLSDQLKGQRQIIAYTMPDADLPTVGEVLCLSTESGPEQGETQFIRITDVDSAMQTFVDGSGTFDRLVVTFAIGSELQYRFYGQNAQRRTDVQPDTLMRTTTVAAVSRYYATTPVTANVTLGDTTVRASSVFTPIVPSAQTETPVVDARALGDRIQVVPAGDQLTRTVNTAFDATVYLGRPIVLGSLTLDDYGYSDDGTGNIYGVGNTLFATVNYEAGTVTPQTPQSRSNLQVTFVPGAAVTSVSWTAGEDITLATRGYNYSWQLRPMPYKGTVIVDYRAQGRWYRLRDRGNGELVGDLADTGTGTINFQTGTVLVTLAALPDVDTAVIVYWGTRTAHTHVDAGFPAAVEVRQSLDHSVYNSSLNLQWTVDSTQYTASYGGYAGNAYGFRNYLMGDAAGNVSWSAGIAASDIRLVLDAIPAAGSSLTYEYKESGQPASTEVAPSAGAVTATLAAAPVEPGSFGLTIGAEGVPVPSDVNPNYSYAPKTQYATLRIADDGAGNLIGDAVPGGTIDYATGAFTVQPLRRVDTHIQSVHTASGFDTSSYDRAVVEFRPSGSNAVVSWNVDVAPGAARTPAITLDELVIGLNPDSVQTLVPGSVMFDFNGWLYVDRAGVLYADIDPNTGAGVPAGTVDYQTGVATLTNWPAGTNTFELHAAALAYAPPSQKSMVFRTSGAPLRPASTQIRATETDGDELLDSADQNGAISAAGMTGTVNAEAGIVRLEFTNPVVPSTVKYNTIVIGYLPLDPDILGLDPVRLPISGRVPSFKVGDVVVIHNTQRQAIATITAGDVLDAGRTRLASARIEDSTGLEVAPALYTADLDAGTLTIDNPADLSAYAAPYELIHRIEDMALAQDVRVNGYISLNGQLSHDYPANTTYISSAVIIGDMQARYKNLFEQQTWQGEFKDNVVGGAPIGQYDDVTYPITVTNRGAVTERWAVIFTSSTSFKVVGEHVGQIAIGETTTDMAPTNPATTVPYFTLAALGWSSGWSAGNVLRFDTVGASYPIWVARTILQAPAEGVRDDFRLQIRGNANRP